MHGIADFFEVPVHVEKVDRRVSDGDGGGLLRFLKILRKEPLISRNGFIIVSTFRCRAGLERHGLRLGVCVIRLE